MRTRISVTAAVLGLGVALIGAAPARASVAGAEGAQIKAGNSNLCLNVKGNSSADNTPVVQWACDDTARNEQFRVLPIGSTGTYQIQAVNSGDCLNVYKGASADGTPVNQFPCSDTGANNLWRFTPVAGKTTYRITSVQSGKCLNVYGNSSVAGTALVIYPCGTTSLNDQFYFPPAASATPGPAQPAPVASPVAAGQGSDGGLGFAYVTDSGALVRGEQTDPDDPATLHWETVPGSFSGAPTLATIPGSTLELDVRHADDGDLWQGEAFGGSLRDVGGSGIGQQSSVLVPGSTFYNVPDTRVTFAVSGGGLWGLRQDGDAIPYGQWRYLGGTGLVGVAAETQIDEAVQVYVRNSAGDLLTARYGLGQLGAFTDLGGAGLVTGAPATIASGLAGAVVMRTVSGQVAIQQQNPDFTWPGTWRLLPGVTAAGTPAVTTNPGGDGLVILVRGTDDLVHAIAETADQSGQFGSWTTYDTTPVATDPTTFEYQSQSPAPGWRWGYVARKTTGDVRIVTAGR